MASVTLTQVGLIAQLRWRIFRNSLRTTRAKLEVVAHGIALVLSGVVVLAIGLGLYAIAFLFAGKSRFGIVLGLLWGIFLAWQFLPVIVAAATTGIEFRELLRFPVRFSAFLLLSLAYSLFDPVTTAVFFWLLCIAAGLLTARPDLFLWIAPAFLGLAAVSILLSRLTMSWIERLFKKRRGRETFFLVFVLGMLSLQLLGLNVEGSLGPVVKFLMAHPGILLALPPNLAYASIEAAMQEDARPALATSVTLALYAFALFLFFRRRLLAQYRGEDLSEGQAPAAAPATTLQTGWRLPVLSGPVAALLEKEIRYALRNGFMVMNLIIPLFVPAVMAAAARSPAKTETIFQRDAGVTYFGGIMYMLFVLMHLALNHFAFEGRGIQLLLMSPASMRQVAAAKNLFYGLIVAGEAAAIWLVLAVVGRAPGAVATAVTLAAIPFLLFAQLATGNLLSIHFPRRFDFGKFKQRQSGMSVLLGMLQQIVTMAIAGGIFAFARWMDVLWIAGLAYLALGAAMWQVYRIGLDHYENLARRRREALIEELCHD